jgi:hypothetical protein
MAAPGYVFTIGYVARQLAIDEATIQDIALEMEPEDGCLSIISDDSGESITASLSSASITYKGCWRTAEPAAFTGCVRLSGTLRT